MLTEHIMASYTILKLLTHITGNHIDLTSIGNGGQ